MRVSNQKMETSSSSKGCLFLLLFPVLLVGGYFLSSHLTKKSAEREAAEQESQQAQETAARTAEEKRLNQPIVVKGLYIGMPIEELPNVVATKFAGWTLQYDQPTFAASSDFGITRIADFGLNAVHIVCDRSRKVVLIEFEPQVSEYIFNAHGLTARQFAEHFADTYNIPTMQARQGYWEVYRLHDKVLVRIDTEKQLVLKFLTDSTALKPSFR